MCCFIFQTLNQSKQRNFFFFFFLILNFFLFFKCHKCSANKLLCFHFLILCADFMKDCVNNLDDAIVSLAVQIFFLSNLIVLDICLNCLFNQFYHSQFFHVAFINSMVACHSVFITRLLGNKLQPGSQVPLVLVFECAMNKNYPKCQEWLKAI